MKFLFREEVGEVLQQIYDAEISFRIESFFDGGYQYYIGDYYNGYGKQYWCDNVLEDAVSEAAFRIFQTYPAEHYATFIKFWSDKIKHAKESNRAGVIEALKEAESLPEGTYDDPCKPHITSEEELERLAAFVDARRIELTSQGRKLKNVSVNP